MYVRITLPVNEVQWLPLMGERGGGTSLEIAREKIK